jgi:hydroxylaminobenzene mutase
LANTGTPPTSSIAEPPPTPTSPGGAVSTIAATATSAPEARKVEARSYRIRLAACIAPSCQQQHDRCGHSVRGCSCHGVWSAGNHRLPIGRLDGVRHPLDPQSVRDTKATAVLALGIVAAVTGPFVGGLVPATLALLLARQARADLRAAGGFLTGARRLRTGVSLAWTGLVFAAATLVIAVIVGLLQLAGGPGGQDFSPGVD